MPAKDESFSQEPESDWRVVNDELFAERAQLLQVEADLDKKQNDDPSPELELSLRQCRYSLDRVNARIVETNTGLVLNCVSHFTKSATDDQRDEYKAAGMTGLVEAMNTYDASSGKFSTWAYWPVLRSVMKAVNASEHQLLSTRDFEKRPAVQNAIAELEQTSDGEAPTLEVIAAKAGVPVEQVARIQLATFSDGEDETWGKKLAARWQVDEWADPPIPQEVEDEAWMDQIREVLKDVPFRDLYVFIRRRMMLEELGVESYEEIGRHLGISREAVRKSELRAVEAIRAKGWKLPPALSDEWTED